MDLRGHRWPARFKLTHYPSADVLDFGHEVQRHRMERFLRRRHPIVVIIHGEAYSGHRHVAGRVQHDLERAGNVLWRPMATLRWFVAGEPRLSRSQLAGGIATALDVSDRGTQEELEGRIARVIAERTADERVLVIDLVEVVTLADESQAEALLTLIHGLWTDLMDRAADYRSALPVYLLLSVAYPKPLPDGHRGAKRIAKRIDLTRKTIGKIAARPRLQGRIRVEVLPELEPIDEDYVVDFLGGHGIDGDLVRSAVEKFRRVREIPGLMKKPATGELLVWAWALHTRGVAAQTLRRASLARLPLWQTLLKDRDDYRRLQEAT